MGHLTLLVAPLFNRQMVEQAELMVKLALKDQGKDVRGEEEHSTAALIVAGKDEPQEEETRPGEDHQSEKKRKTEERDADRAHDKRAGRRRDRRDGVKQGDQGRHATNRNQAQGDQKEKEVQILLQPNRKDRGGSKKDQKLRYQEEWGLLRLPSDEEGWGEGAEGRRRGSEGSGLL